MLPPLPDDIPEYYREIVTSCRLEHPIQRPSARELLDKLLAEQPHYQSKDIPNVASDDAPDPGRQMRCNICQSIGLKHYYHCDTCDGADYDICHKCFGKGLHCLDPSHFILEYFADSESAPGPYFSSVKSSGQRIAMHLWCVWPRCVRQFDNIWIHHFLESIYLEGQVLSIWAIYGNIWKYHRF